MRLAQQLYEGVDIKGSGTVGVITYLRTDSVRISDEADAAARSYIGSQYGENYVSEAAKTVKKGQKIQDAHEAIRPTDISRTPVQINEEEQCAQPEPYQGHETEFKGIKAGAAFYPAAGTLYRGFPG